MEPEPLDVFARPSTQTVRTTLTALLIAIIAFLLVGCAQVANESAGEFQGGRFAFVTTGTNSSVESYRRDPVTGALTFIDTLVVGTEPRRIVADHSSRLLYAAMSGETDLRGLRVDPDTGKLTNLGVDVACGFDLTIHPTRNLLYCALGPDVSQYQINATTGVLTSMSTASQGASLNGLFVTPNGKFLYATDINDSGVYGFVLNPSTGIITGATPTAFMATDPGPINAAIDPFSRFLFVANMTGNTVTAYAILANGDLSYAGAGSATQPQALTVSADGTTLYVAATGDNEVQRYAINQTTGDISLIDSFSRNGGPLAPTVAGGGTHLYVGQDSGPGIGLYRVEGDGSLTHFADYGGGAGQIWGILPVDVH
ncbi:MAG TPA: beta-propeller fold lactonase family protein [bacterium]